MKTNNTKSTADKIVSAVLKFIGNQKFASAKLSDGTEVEYSALEVGAEFKVPGEEGALVPAPVGEYELEDGSVIVVAEVGKIGEIKPAAPKEEETKEEEMAEEKPAEEKTPPKAGLDWSQQIDDMKRQLTWQAERIASLVTAMQMFKSDASEVFSAFKEYIEQETQAGNGAITPPRQTRFNKTETKKEDAKNRFAAAFKAFDSRKTPGEVKK